MNLAQLYNPHLGGIDPSRVGLPEIAPPGWHAQPTVVRPLSNRVTAPTQPNEPRARRNGRHELVRAAVEQHPGATLEELVAVLNEKDNTDLSSTLSRLVAMNRVRREGEPRAYRFFPVGRGTVQPASGAARIYAYLGKHPGADVNQIRASLRDLSPRHVSQALSDGCRGGVLRVEGRKRHYHYFLVERPHA